MPNYKTVPNQKIVTVKKVATKDKIFAQIEMNALEQAARDLDAGAFKLWVYFSKNQTGFEFALSSKAVEETFGIKVKQYNNAVSKLIDKGYLVSTGGNSYTFNEIPVITKSNNEEKEKNSVIPKGNNEVITKSNNALIPKGNNALLPKDIRNNTNITFNNTLDNTDEIGFYGGGAVSSSNQEVIDEEYSAQFVF